MIFSRLFKACLFVAAIWFIGVMVYVRLEPVNKIIRQTETYDLNNKMQRHNDTDADTTAMRTGIFKNYMEDNKNQGLPNSIYFKRLNDSEARPGNVSFPNSVSPDEGNISAVKTILFWNPWFVWRDYKFGLGRDVFVKKCNTDQCETVTAIEEFRKADAVVFFAAKLRYSNQVVLPTRGYPQQIYVFFNSEPPAKYGTRLRSTNIGEYFNVTISYMQDSTIWWPYGRVIPRETHYQPMTRSQVKAKNGTVAWMVSMCKDYNVRKTYCSELNKYIPVDVYGRCGHLKCPEKSRYSTECIEFLAKRYKFYLAFENSHCVDYITEKAFRTLQYNIILIVMGGANYTKYLPPKSFINVKDFDSPKHLAEYLIYLDNNPDEYLKYFQWKRHYTVEEDIPNSDRVFCELCEMLRKKRSFHLDYNVADWWEKDTCITNVTDLRKVYHLD